MDSSGDLSPSLDQGYATLLGPSSSTSTTLRSRQSASQQTSFTYPKDKHLFSHGNMFDRVSDEVIVKIFTNLTSYDLSVCASVCRRFEQIIGTPSLWKVITLPGTHISGDRAIRSILRRLCGQSPTGMCNAIERVYLTEGATITDRGISLLAKRCPNLTHVQAQGSKGLTNQSLRELVTRCHLQHLDVAGCIFVTCVSPDAEIRRRIPLQYLDLTDCVGIRDADLKTIITFCPMLVYLYLRRCLEITDVSLGAVPNFCSYLKELSVSDCKKITDNSLYQISYLGPTLRYLSIAKCNLITDAGIKAIARKCYNLRYLNARGCEAISDDSIGELARSSRLRSLDIGKCDVSDAGLRALAHSCPNLKNLSVRNCDLVTDRGVQTIAYYCRGLQQLNIQECHISLEGYRAVKKFCKRYPDLQLHAIHGRSNLYGFKVEYLKITRCHIPPEQIKYPRV